MSFTDSKVFIDAKNDAEITVSKAYGLTRSMIDERSRSKYHCLLRHGVWFYLNTKYSLTVVVIAEIYGYNHSTVWAGIRKAEMAGIKDLLGCVDKV